MKDMKKMTYFLAAAMLLLLPSCRFVKVNKEVLDNLDEQVDVFQGGSEKITASDNYITRKDTTGEFHAITCNLPAEVIYENLRTRDLADLRVALVHGRLKAADKDAILSNLLP